MGVDLFFWRGCFLDKIALPVALTTCLGKTTIFFFGDVDGSRVDVAEGILGRFFFESSKTMEVGAVEVKPWFDLLQDTPKKRVHGAN